MIYNAVVMINHFTSNNHQTFLIVKTKRERQKIKSSLSHIVVLIQLQYHVKKSQNIYSI